MGDMQQQQQQQWDSQYNQNMKGAAGNKNQQMNQPNKGNMKGVSDKSAQGIVAKDKNNAKDANNNNLHQLQNEGMDVEPTSTPENESQQGSKDSAEEPEKKKSKTEGVDT